MRRDAFLTEIQMQVDVFANKLHSSPAPIGIIHSLCYYETRSTQKCMQHLIDLSELGDVEPENCCFFNTSIKSAAVNISMLKLCNIMLISLI